MKKAQREIYRTLANEVDFGLCCFCKFSESMGSLCDGGGDIDCCHPLADKASFDSQIEGAMDLGDCWGFRPAHPVEFVADIVGAVLANEWTEASWWQDKKGLWKVAGRVGD